MNGKSGIIIAALAGVAAASGAYLAANGGANAFSATVSSEVATMTISFDGTNTIIETQRALPDGTQVVDYNNAVSHATYTVESDGSYKLVECMDLTDAARIFGQPSWMVEDNLVRIAHMGMDYTVELDENNVPVSLSDKANKFIVQDFSMGATTNFKTGPGNCAAPEARALHKASEANDGMETCENNEDLDDYNTTAYWNSVAWNGSEAENDNGQTGRTHESCYAGRLQNAMGASYCRGPLPLQQLAAEYPDGDGGNGNGSTTQAETYNYLRNNNAFYSTSGGWWNDSLITSSSQENSTYMTSFTTGGWITARSKVAANIRTNCGPRPQTTASCKLFVAGDNQGVTMGNGVDTDVMLFCLRSFSDEYWYFSWLGFAGSNSLDDWFNNANGLQLYVSSLALRVHRGMWNEAKHFIGLGSEYYAADRIAYTRARATRYHLGGHSLGGGIAQLLTRYLERHYYNDFNSFKQTNGGSPKPWWGSAPSGNRSRNYRTGKRGRYWNKSGDGVPCLGALSSLVAYFRGIYKATRTDGMSQDMIAERRKGASNAHYVYYTGKDWFGGYNKLWGNSYKTHSEMMVSYCISGTCRRGYPSLTTCIGFDVHSSKFYAHSIPRAFCHQKASGRSETQGNASLMSGVGRTTNVGQDHGSVPDGHLCTNQLYGGRCYSSPPTNYYCVKGSARKGTCKPVSYCCKYHSKYGGK